MFRHLDQLRTVYAENDCPSDRLLLDPAALNGLVAELNRRAGTCYTPGEVAGVLIRCRKNKKGTGGLPPLGRDFGGPKFRAEDN